MRSRAHVRAAHTAQAPRGRVVLTELAGGALIFLTSVVLSLIAVTYGLHTRTGGT